MLKGVKRIGYKKEKYWVFMKIVSVEVPVKEPFTNVHVEWKRRNKNATTSQDRVLTPEQTIAHFD